MKDNLKNPYVILVGNEKGGVGKTTISMHLITSLLYDGYKVASFDIDSRQRSLSNYLENRQKTIEAKKLDILMPQHMVIAKTKLDSVKEGEKDEQSRFDEAFKNAALNNDVIVIDAPGNDTFLSRFAHSYADTIITPINDSFVDLNLLAKVEDATFRMDRHGLYSEVVWQAKMQKAYKFGGEVDWVIIRNRLAHVDAHNKRNMLVALEGFSKRSGARLAEGLSERVIYKELFLKGLTLLDVLNENADVGVTLSHVSARQELRRFMDFLNVKEKLDQRKMLRNAASQSLMNTEDATSVVSEAVPEMAV